MGMEIFRNLYDNFDTNINVDYKKLVFMYEKYLERFMHSKDIDFLICVSVGFQYVNVHFEFDNGEIDFGRLNEFIKEKNNEMEKVYETKKIDIALLSYALATNCYPFINSKDESLNEKLRLTLLNNSYIINKVLLNDKERTNKMN